MPTVASHRAFYADIDGALPEPERKSHADLVSPDKTDTLAQLREAVVGHDAVFSGPYGTKHLLYADWAASGRALAPIEKYISEEVLPLYANTHTTTSVTGLQSTCFRLEARQIVAQECNARVSYSDKHSDVVLFTGSGSTAAINKMVQILGLHEPLPAGTPDSQRAVVFVGPYEHHSNLLPWRESAAEVVQIPEDGSGAIDRAALALQLAAHAHRPLRIGSFSAASNVTGVVSDVDAVTEQLHRAGALAFWDYAAAAPYCPLDMNPVRVLAEGGVNPWVYKDAVFASLHKLPGGPGCPGLLVAKKALFRNPVPSAPGGGTIFFVTDQDHRYLSNREEREEGGTQDVVGSIRAGLVLQAKAAVGQPTIEAAEGALTHALHAALGACPGLTVLGPPPEPSGARLPLLSFLVRAPAVAGRSRFLHYNFVCAVLNDLFGVQTRGGCACAGPYGISLLGLSERDAQAIEAQLLDDMEVLRPGFTRVSLPYFASAEEVEYVLEAVRLVAAHAWRLLPHYSFNHKTGEWKHRSRLRSFPERRWLAHIPWPRRGPSSQAATPVAGAAQRDWSAQLEAAKGVLEACGGSGFVSNLMVNEEQVLGGERTAAEEVEKLRWFMYPTEAAAVLEDLRTRHGAARPPPASRPVPHPPLPLSAVPSTGPLAGSFTPKRYTLSGIAGTPEQPAEGSAAHSEQHSGQRPGGSGGSGGSCAACPSGNPCLAPVPAPSPRATSEHPVDSRATSEHPVDSRATSEHPVDSRATSEHPVDSQGGDAVQSSNGSKAAEVEGSKAAEVEGDEGEEQEEQVWGAGEDDEEADWTSGCSGGPILVEARAVSRKYPLRGPTAPADPRPWLGAPSTAACALGSCPDDAPVPALSLFDDTDPPCFLDDGDGDGDAAGCPEPSAAVQLLAGREGVGAGGIQTPPAKLMKLVKRAVSEWGMIKEGDRLLLGLSGGKDSLALLHCLATLQRFFPPGYFTLAAATVDPGTAAFNPRPLIPYMASLGIQYHYLETPIFDMAESCMSGDSICAFCSRMKRGSLYSCCRDHGYNVLVLGQHLDDLAESFLMSMMYNGVMRTMKAHYTIDAGDVRVIRPLMYAREKMMRDFSYAARLPVINENCPACFEEPKERHRVKKLLAKEETLFPTLYSSLSNAMRPLMHESAQDVLSVIQHQVAERFVSRGRKANGESKRRKKPVKGAGEDPEDRPQEVKVLAPQELAAQTELLSQLSEEQLLQELSRRQQHNRNQNAQKSENSSIVGIEE